MTRKQRKQARKKNSQPKQKNDEFDVLACILSSKITKFWKDRDKSNDGKIISTKERGCYNECGKIVLCSTCFYKKACRKWLDGIEDYLRRH